MDRDYCHSCSLPISPESDYGINADGSLNKDYCCACYHDGSFREDLTMEQMVNKCADVIIAHDEDTHGNDRQKLILKLMEFFPYLKRWQLAPSE